MQTSADHRSRRRHVGRMTDEKVRLSYSYDEHMLCHLVEVCVSVCLRDNLKTICRCLPTAW